MTALARCPPGVRYELGGLYAQQQIDFAGLTAVLAAALVAEFVLLLFLCERLWIPVIVLGASALSTTAVFAGLWLNGTELNITAIIGMTMIIGIGTKMAIFLVSGSLDLERGMPPRHCLQRHGTGSARSDDHSRRHRDLAAACPCVQPRLRLAATAGDCNISGLLVQFPLVLLGVPVLIALTLAQGI